MYKKLKRILTIKKETKKTNDGKRSDSTELANVSIQCHKFENKLPPSNLMEHEKTIVCENTNIFEFIAEVHASNENANKDEIEIDENMPILDLSNVTLSEGKFEEKLEAAKSSITKNQQNAGVGVGLDIKNSKMNAKKLENISSTIIEKENDVIGQVVRLYDEFPDLRTELRVLSTDNAVVYLLGTNHVDPQCAIDTANIIEKIEPQTVVIELCAWRACGCPIHLGNVFQTKPKFTFRYLRRVITQIGFLPAMIFFTDAFNEQHAVHDLTDYGAEFAVAAHFCDRLRTCRVILGDRDIQITVKRQASGMSNWRGIRITVLVTLSLIFKKYTNILLLRGHLLVMRDAKFYQIVVFERDIFLAYMIRMAATNFSYDLKTPPKIVAVVGQGHLNGIQNFWGRIKPSLLPLILTPEVKF